MNENQSQPVPLAIVRKARKGWTARALSIASGVPLGTIGPVEHGYRKFTPEARERIRTALGLTEAEARFVEELAP